MEDDILEEISEAAAEWRRLRKQIPETKDAWNCYVFFAQRKPIWQDFMLDELSKGTRYEYLIRPKFNMAYAKTESYSVEEGRELLYTVLKTVREKEEAEKVLSGLLKRAWKAPTEDEPGNLELPLEDIEKAYGGSGSAARAFIGDQPWFQKRDNSVANAESNQP